MKTIVSEKGQITIPKALRDRLGLEPGQVLDFREQKGRLIAEKLPFQDPVSGVYGVLELGKGTDHAMREVRGGSEPE